jgi:hypothetical protein
LSVAGAIGVGAVSLLAIEAKDDASTSISLAKQAMAKPHVAPMTKRRMPVFITTPSVHPATHGTWMCRHMILRSYL